MKKTHNRTDPRDPPAHQPNGPTNMNFADCLDYLNSLGHEVLTMKLGLENIRALLAGLDNPHREYPCILVAGTNGKGSTARFLASILEHSGYRTGLYTSPHLVDVRERIAVAGRPVSEKAFAESFTQVVTGIRDLSLPCHPTYFETLTATGFVHFSQAEVEVAVLEIGLGGRLDSTNVVLPKLSVITPVGIDHTNVLGGTLEQIAAEKGGIIHPQRPVVLGWQPPEAEGVLREIARRRHAPVCRLQPDEITEIDSDDGRYRFQLANRHYRLPLYGRHQVENAALALKAAEKLQAIGFVIRAEVLPRAIESLTPYSVLRRLREHPALFVDGGHNPDAARRLGEFVRRHTRAPRALILGMMRDKQIREVGEVLAPAFDRIYLTPVNDSRAATPAELRQAVPGGIPTEDWQDALGAALSEFNTVVITGSFYLIGEVVEQLDGPVDRFWDAESPGAGRVRTA